VGAPGKTGDLAGVNYWRSHLRKIRKHNGSSYFNQKMNREGAGGEVIKYELNA
jgi:hypothetical protein